MKIWCEIDKESIVNNLDAISRISNGKDIIAVVKSDCYGLGAKNIVPILDEKVNMYAVNGTHEAIKLETLKDVLILAPSTLEIVPGKRNFIYTIDEFEDIDIIPNEAKIRVHIFCNTDMNRKGINLNNLDFCIHKIKSSKQNVSIEGIYTHIGTLGYSSAIATRQIKKFLEAVEKYRESGYKIHFLNTGGIFDERIPKELKDKSDMIRIGNAIYGMRKLNSIKKVFKIRTSIEADYTSYEGGSVGYTGKYKIPSGTRIGLIQVGTAEKIGFEPMTYKRSLKASVKKLVKDSKNAIFSSNGNPLKLICPPMMNCCLIDLTGRIEKKGDIIDISMSPLLLDQSVTRIIR